MAELEIREPGGDRSAGVANAGFQTALTVPTLSVSSNQGAGGWGGGVCVMSTCRQVVHHVKGWAERAGRRVSS